MSAFSSLVFLPSREARCCSKASSRLLGAWESSMRGETEEIQSSAQLVSLTCKKTKTPTYTYSNRHKQHPELVGLTGRWQSTSGSRNSQGNMQKTLTLLAGDSKERHNKGGGWKRVRKKLKRGCALFSWLPEHRAIISMPGLPFATFASLSYSSCSALTPRRPVKQCQAVLFTSDLSVCLCCSFTNSLCIYCTCRLRSWPRFFFPKNKRG